MKSALVLLEIDADDQCCAFAENFARAAQEGACLVRIEIADGRARKEADFRHVLDFGRQLERFGEIGRHRIDREVGKILAQGAGLSVEKIAGNIHRHISAEGAFIQQQADLGCCACAEFDQRCAGGIVAAISEPRSRRMRSSVRVG